MRRILFCLLCLTAVLWGTPPCLADPDRVTIDSALVWRTDGAGDYLLPDLQPQSTYELPTAVSTAGQMESLTAVWDFDGQVSLELSADGGLHYTSAVYGVPLTKELVQGNRLKWRVKLEADSHLREVKIAYQDSSRVAGAFGDPRLSGFKYRKRITINGSDELLAHYQIALAIGESGETAAYDVNCEGHVRSDFADIRVTAADGLTVLPYYLETVVGTSPAGLAVVWVNIPQLPPTGTSLYLYYGNPTASSLSDGKAVFDFFDQFDGATLDPKVWNSQAGQGSIRVADSKLHLTGASVITKTFQLGDGIVEYLATTDTNKDDARLIIRSDPQAMHPDESSQVAYASAYGGAEHVLAVGSIVQANDPKPIVPQTPYGYQIIVRGTKLAFQRYDAEFANVQATVTFNDASGLTRGALGLHSEGSASYDWIRVRRLVVPPPAVAETTAQAREETANLPLFVNTLVRPNGDLALADPKLEGSYTTPAIASEFAVRTLVPEWEGNAAAVAVSADGGKTFRQQCQAGAHYYASKGHFMPGKSLVATVDLRGTDETPSPALHSVSLDYTAGNLFVVSPNGGEQLVAGTTFPVTWSALGHDATYPMKLTYSLDGGKTYQVIADSTENDGTQVWVLPEDASSDDVIVRVADRNDPSVFDESDEPFSIQPAGAVKQRQAQEAAAAAQKSDVAYTDDLLTLLDKLTQDPNAKPQDIVVKVTESGDYKAGDIVLIRPAGTEWSEAEKNSFLIIQADLSPQAIQMLTSPAEVPSGKIGPDGKPLLRQLGKRKFKIDLSFFDLKPRTSDRGKPSVRRHYKEKEDLRLLLEDRAEQPATAAQPGISNGPK